MTSHVPPGWPPGVPPSEVFGWQDRAVAWLLDQCPPDYRSHSVLRRHPVALAWLTQRHVAGQIEATREAYRNARVHLGPSVSPQALTEILAVIEAEGLRLIAVRRSADLVHQAMEGKHFVPRL